MTGYINRSRSLFLCYELMMRNICFLWILLGVSILWTKLDNVQTGNIERVWVQTSFDDFSKGRLVDAGSNLYISRRGSIQTVNRWDLNGDGYIDLIFNNSHDEWQTIPAYLYLGKEGGIDSGSRIELPADGASKGLVHDLNKDGYPELIIANTFNGTTMKLNAYIYWGSAVGYSPAMRTELPTLGARQVVIGDFNKDGFFDLAFAQQGDVGDNPRAGYGSVDNRTSYVYWGGEDGYTMHRRQALETIAATDAAVADFDADGYDDLIILNNSVNARHDLVLFRGGRSGLKQASEFGGKKLSFVATGDINNDRRRDIIVGYKEENVVRIYLGDGQRINSEKPAVTLHVQSPQDAASDDLNNDGRADLVIAAGGPVEGASYIYFAGNKGVSDSSRVSVSTNGALACAIADINADGHKDVIFANSVDEESFSTDSYIYWNGPGGFDAGNRQELPTIGASDVMAVDVDGNKTLDLLFIGYMGGRRKSDVRAYIYMSDADDPANLYKVHNRLELPTVYGYESSVADLNEDGYPDIILANLASRDPSQNPGSYIYWGGKTGYSPLTTTSLKTDMGGWASSVADFNRDGYLDVLYTQLKSGINLIFYGTTEGPRHERVGTFRDPEARDARTAAVADLNKDGYLDVIVPFINSPWVSIFWGSSGGDYSSQRISRLPSMATVSVEIADLNRDGWLDLVLCNFWDTETLSHQINSYIYWGGEEGFSPINRQELPNGAAHDASIADVNQDGYLDIVFSNYHRGQLRHGIPSYVYLGSEQGFFRRENRIELINDSAGGNLIADLNHDGHLDIVFANHTLWGRHDNANSRIFWGGPMGPNNANVTLLPTVGPHQMTSTDIGNIYSRELEEFFESEPFNIGQRGKALRIEWDADVPTGSRVKMQIRTAATRHELESGRWVGWDGPRSFYTLTGERLRGIPSEHHWIQYRAILESDFGATWPTLNEVRIIYTQ